jgi:hypothetical protein
MIFKLKKCSRIRNFKIHKYSSLENVQNFEKPKELDGKKKDRMNQRKLNQECCRNFLKLVNNKTTNVPVAHLQC